MDVAQLQEDRSIGVSGDKLERLVAYAEHQRELEAQIAEWEKQGKDLAGAHKKVSEEDIPNLMTELGISEFKLADGSKISVKPFYSGSLAQSNPNREAAFKWLKENGFDDIIKNEVSVSFGRGEEEKAAIAMAQLESVGFEPSQDRNVHASTLKAFLKEQVEAGRALPLELFKAYIGRKAKID